MTSRDQSRCRRRRYTGFRRLDGAHPFRAAVPGGFVDYRARRLPGTEVVWFHFPLAKELGLIAANHPHRLNQTLRQAICGTFGLEIINEYDQMHASAATGDELLPGHYMATRYLALQHPGRLGATSGDGRSIWNGTLTHRGRTWDISSCGTGVTRLCPATAEQNRFFQTANDHASYGCGTASMDESFETLIMSEAFHRNGLATERVLAILERSDGYAIVVRAAPNLLRPSHFFAHLKQNSLEALQGAVDHHIARQVANGAFPRLRRRTDRYRFLAEEAARTFARLVATCESEYIFCWLDWDGDNILADGGIIDYGSVRQFGLYHREYRFDDGPRMSTTIPEQKRKARLIVQNFAQIRDFLVNGKRSPLASFAGDPVLDLFDAEFENTRLRLMVHNIGYPPALQDRLLSREPEMLQRFRRAHASFERARSAKGPEPVPDGLTWNAIFSTRDLLRELPHRYLQRLEPVSPERFMAIASSTYAAKEDRCLTSHRRRMSRLFQDSYLEMIRRAARHGRRSVADVLASVAGRAAVINRRTRITGDGVALATNHLLEARPQLTFQQLQQIIERFIAGQILIPEVREISDSSPPRHPGARSVLSELEAVIADCRHGL